MYRWWRERGDRAWWVVVSVSLHSPDNIGVLDMSGGFTPRHVHMFRNSDRIVPRITTAEGNYIVGCLRLPRLTTVTALALKPTTLSRHKTIRYTPFSQQFPFSRVIGGHLGLNTFLVVRFWKTFFCHQIHLIGDKTSGKHLWYNFPGCSKRCLQKSTTQYLRL